MRLPLIAILAISVACAKKPADEPPPTQTAPAAATVAKKQVITQASGVRIRATAAADGTEVVRLPIGTVLDESERNGEWARVTTTDGQQGWMSTTVLRDLDTEHPEQTYLTLAQERTANDKLTFPERADLYFALARAASESKDHTLGAQLELARIAALEKALEPITVENYEKQPFKGFATQLGDTIVYSEPAGAYLVSTDKLWNIVKTYKDAPVGESLAWKAATTPQPGECEGYFGCWATVTNMSYGRYLQELPAGAHLSDALHAYETMDAPTKQRDYEEWDGESLQDVQDALASAEKILDAVDPAAAKAAKAKLAKNRALIAKFMGRKK